MCCRATPMNLNQESNKKSRKTYRSISHKGLQKFTFLNRNGVQVRDGLDRMTRNLKKQIIELSKLMRGDTRISTPLNGSTSDEWHDVVKRKGLIIRTDRLLYQRYTKSRGHYLRSNDILFSPYPTIHKLNVGWSGVDREVRVELSDQNSLRKMIYI